MTASIPSTDDDLFDDVFAQSDQAAAAAIESQTPEEVLGEYVPGNSSTASTVGTSNRQPSIQTAPTSIGIHNEVAADVSDIATFGQSEDEVVVWGAGSGFGDGPFRPTTRRKTGRAPKTTTMPTFAQLPTWFRICVYCTVFMLLALATSSIDSFMRGMTSPMTNVLGGTLQQNATFRTTYFSTLSRVPTWRRIPMSLIGILWLSSVVYCIRSFRDMLAERISNHTIQIRLLTQTFLWLLCSALDGVLRLRAREEIAISMITILMLMLVLSTFARHLAAVPAVGVAR
jgi:hypothetical protein